MVFARSWRFSLFGGAKIGASATRSEKCFKPEESPSTEKLAMQAKYSVFCRFKLQCIQAIFPLCSYLNSHYLCLCFVFTVLGRICILVTGSVTEVFVWFLSVGSRCRSHDEESGRTDGSGSCYSKNLQFDTMILSAINVMDKLQKSLRFSAYMGSSILC